MLKALAAMATAAALLAAGFVVLPKVLLKAPGASVQSDNRSVPLGQSRALPSITPVAVSGGFKPAALRIEDFQLVQANAGFAPLTPASLPNGYQERERYFRTGNRPAVIFTYLKPELLYIIVVERKLDPSAPVSQRPDNIGGQRPPGSPFSSNGQAPRVDIGGASGFYAQGLSRAALNALADVLTGRQLQSSQLHSVLFTRGDIEITVVADLNDVPRDQLIEIARGLH